MSPAPGTIESFKETLEVIGGMSQADLAAMTIPELRTMARTGRLTRVKRGDELVSVGAARKAELVAALVELGQLQVRQNPGVIDGTDREDHFNRLAKKIEGKIFDAAVRMIDPVTGELVGVAGADFQSLSGILATALAGLHSGQNQVSAATKMHWRSFTVKAITDRLRARQDSVFKAQALALLGDFKRALFAIPLAPGDQNLGIALKDKGMEELAKRQQAQQKVDITALLGWAADTLKHGTGNVLETSIALSLVTGRRCTEVHRSATFEAVEGQTHALLFGGQAKTKDGSRRFYDEVPKYEIPTLVPASWCIRGLERLEAMGGRVPMSDPERAVNKRFSGRISETLGGKRGRIDFQALAGFSLHYHQLRALYAIAATKAFYTGSTAAAAQYTAKILGHNRTGDNQVADDTTLRYLADFELAPESLETWWWLHTRNG